MAGVESEQKEPQEGIKSVRLEWGPTDDLVTIYVNQVQISHASQMEFYVIFGEVPVPAINNPDNPVEFPDQLTIIPKVRLVMSPQAMKNISSAFSGNYEQYVKHLEK